MSQHPSYRGRRGQAAVATAERPATPEPAVYTPALRHAGRACCCLAPPAVIVMVPPGDGRPGATDLLLCGHHYRASKAALAAFGATMLDIRGYRLASDAWPGDPETEPAPDTAEAAS